jgi:hypothetical protein
VNNPDLHACFIEYKAKIKHAELNNLPKPRLPNYIGKAIMDIAERYARKPKFSYYCVDRDTTALTKRGWLDYTQLTIDDEVLSLNPDTKHLEWSPILDIYRGDYNDKMFKLKHKRLNALVTPGHKFLTKENGLVPIDTVKVQQHIITMGAGVLDTSEIYVDEFVRLVGWWVTDGSYYTYNRRGGGETYHGYVAQSKSANPEKCEDIEHCIATLQNKQLSHYLSKNNVISYSLDTKLVGDLVGVAPNKILSYNFINSLSLRQKEMLVDTMIKGDGSVSINTPQYFQKDKNHIDSFVYLCTLAGWTTSSYYSEWKTGFGMCSGYRVTLSKKYTCTVENINMDGGRRAAGGTSRPHSPTQEYSGVVWCPTTIFGNWVCRRGRNIYITGNSYKSEMISDGILACVKYADGYNPDKYENPLAYITQIVHNAFINRLNLEHKQAYVKALIVKNNGNLVDDENFNPDSLSNTIKVYENKMDQRKIKAAERTARIKAEAEELESEQFEE